MTDVGGAQVGDPAAGSPGEEYAPTVIDAYYSLLAEGVHLRKLPEEKQRFTKVDLDEALRILAENRGTISPAARYHALEQLARPIEEGLMPKPGGLPGYEGMSGGRGDLYRDFAATFAATGQADELVEHIHVNEGGVPPDETMLSKEAQVVLDPGRVCSSDLVTAHTNAGTAERTLCLFSQFDSSADFNVLAGWLDPSTWPARGPLLFKSVQVVEPPGQVAVPEKVGTGWRGTYLEEVELIGRRLLTYLDCAYQSRDGYAALTYDLHESVGEELTVDRGYLSVTRNPDGRHQVRALKLVSFTDGDEAVYEDIMCPVWTDCVQQAAETPLPPGGAGKAPPPSTPGPVVLDPEEFGRRWTECMSDASAAYTSLAVDVAQELAGGRYDMDDYRRHGMWLWTNLARDWSRAWVGTLEVAEQVARIDRGDPSDRAGSVPPPTARVFVGPVGEQTKVTVSDLTGIGGNRRIIPSADLDVSPSPLLPGATITATGADGTEVTVTARISGVPSGLYIGELRAGAAVQPVLLYVSDALRSAGAAV